MQTDTPVKLLKNNDPDFLCYTAQDKNAYYIAKRAMDLFVAITLLAMLSPLMLLTAALIYIYSPGPIFFVQERVGARRMKTSQGSYWKRENFGCIKFRTMKTNADPSIHQAYVRALIENDQDEMDALQGGSIQTRKLVHDNRIIQPGKFLRKFSIDELPQFWNVVRGEMSVVGPRPAIPYEVEVYKHWHIRRLEAQPGITGLQQVTARCNVDFDTQVRRDIEYIEHQSLWLDTKIILQTPLAIISTKGAH